MSVFVLDSKQRPLMPCGPGDMVKATVRVGKKTGVHVGRVAIRATGGFNIQTTAGVIQGIGHKYCKVLIRGDGYAYSLHPSHKQTNRLPPPAKAQRYLAMEIL